jgi:hypothetical protein
MISIDELYEVVKTASAPAPAPQNTPGGQAMAAAAKMAAPPGAPPMPQPIEQPQQEAAADPTAEQQKHLQDIAKKDKEIQELRTQTHELKLDLQRMQMTSELQKQQQAMLDKVRAEQKLLDKKQTEFHSNEAAHKANLEKETARHEVMRAKADAKSLADIATRDAESIKANAEQNAKNYIKMVEDARKTTDSYMASKEKAFAQTQEDAKKNSPYISVALRSNIDGALAAAKNIGKLRSRIAKDDIKFNKVANNQGSATGAASTGTNMPAPGNTNLNAAGMPGTSDFAEARAARRRVNNRRRYDKALNAYADKISYMGESSTDANNEAMRLAGYGERTDVQNNAALYAAVNRARERATTLKDSRLAKEKDIVKDPNATSYARNKAQAAIGRTTMAAKAYGSDGDGNDIYGTDSSATVKSDNWKARQAGKADVSWQELEQQKQQSEDNTNRWYHSVGNFFKGMVTGIWTGPRDAYYAKKKSEDAAAAFGVERDAWGAKGKNGINTEAFADYANANGLSQGWVKGWGSLIGNAALSVASVIPVGGLAMNLARGGMQLATMAGRQAIATGLRQAGKTMAQNFATKGVARGLGSNAMYLGGKALGAMPSNAQVMGRAGAFGKSLGSTIDNVGLAAFGTQIPGLINSKYDYSSTNVANSNYEDIAGSQNDITNYNMAKVATIMGAYNWQGNGELTRLKHTFKNPYNSTLAGSIIQKLSPFVSQATGGRINLAPAATIPFVQRRPLNVERAIQDFHSQHWRPHFNPDANKYPTPAMDRTLRQFQSTQAIRSMAHSRSNPRYQFQDKAERVEALRDMLDELK